MSRNTGRTVIGRVAPIVALAAAVAGLTTTAAASDGVDHGCGSALDLPCAVSPGDVYGGEVIPPSGNDEEAAVEAVLSHILGADVLVSPIERGITGDTAIVDLTPDRLHRTTRFDWSSPDETGKLAYLTVKASTGFAVLGIAGITSGRVDVTDLLGGHDVSHISLWAIDRSPPEPVRAKKLHGRDILGNVRLARIENGTVPCLHVETAELHRCRFGRRSGSWIESTTGNYAVYGQPIALDGTPGGDYVIAAEVNRNGSVPALEPRGRDSTGTTSGTELASSPMIETMLSATNVSGLRLENWATIEVCTSSYPHPDGAELTHSPSEGVYCYIGRGAGLNDINGTERDRSGVYYSSMAYSHDVRSNGTEVPGAKRPATLSFPARVKTDSPLVWRPVDNRLKIAN